MKKYYLITLSWQCMNMSGSLDFGYVADEQHPLSNRRFKELVLSQIERKCISVSPTIENIQATVTNIFQFENEKEYKAFWQ